MKKLKFLSVCFFVAFIFVTFLFSSSVYADNSNPFVFTTDPQSVAPGVSSLVITVQSQDTSGKGLAVGNGAGDTADVVFTSTSPTGQFLNSTGGAVSTTMSYNSYTKNFYYLDSTPGIYTLTVVATTRNSKKVFSASQQIYIGQPVPSDGSSVGNASTTDTTASSTDQTAQNNIDNSNNNSVWSANSSPASLPDTEAPVDFEISAGRDRLTSVGNNLFFTVTPIETQGILSNLIGYTWSFGDGTTAEGDSVHHAYKFPGEYSVVVNATASDQMAVDRLTVKVIDPQIALQKVSGGTEVTNNSADEINLEGWTLSSSGKSFVFPQDTLIPAGGEVTFADDLTGVSSGDLRLQNQLGQTYADISVRPDAEIAGLLQTGAVSGQTKSLSDISESVSDISQKLAVLQSEINRSVAEVAVPSGNGLSDSVSLSQHSAADIAAALPANSGVTVANTISTGADSNSSTSAAENQTATVFVASSSPGIISRIFAWPIQGFNFIRNLFIEK
jgi:hypothetical protein